MMQLNRIHHIAVICSDYERSKRFYVELLGLEVLHESYREEKQSWRLDLRIGERDQLELFSFPNPPERVDRPEARGLRHLAFEVKSVEETAASLQQKGIAVEPIRIDPITGKPYTFFADPDGLPLELVEQ